MGRDYTVGSPTGPQVPPTPPRPGHGTVFVNTTVDGAWAASWQDGPRLADIEGERAEVVAWALAQPAENHLVFSAADDDYVPLGDSRQNG
jgi:hypothetical protein